MGVDVGRTANVGGADGAADLEDRMIRTKLTMDGEFKDRIAELKTERERLEKVQGIVDTQTKANKLLAEAGAIRAQAEQALKDAQSVRDAATVEAKQLLERAKAELENVNARNDEALALEARVAARDRAVMEAEAAIPGKLAQRSADLDAREAAIEKDEAKVKADKEVLDRTKAAWMGWFAARPE